MWSSGWLTRDPLIVILTEASSQLSRSRVGSSSHMSSTLLLLYILWRIFDQKIRHNTYFIHVHTTVKLIKANKSKAINESSRRNDDGNVFCPMQFNPILVLNGQQCGHNNRHLLFSPLLVRNHLTLSSIFIYFPNTRDSAAFL